jgi:hypothetical protein
MAAITVGRCTWNIRTMAHGYVPPVSLDADLGRAAASWLGR